MYGEPFGKLHMWTGKRTQYRDEVPLEAVHPYAI